MKINHGFIIVKVFVTMFHVFWRIDYHLYNHSFTTNSTV